MLLPNLKVIDMTGPLGFLAGKTLADLGAQVIKVEPPKGDEARNWPPFCNDGTTGVFWAALNANKSGVTIDLGTAHGKEQFALLMSTADILIESFRPGYLESIGSGFEDLRKKNPGLIWVSITPYGQEGPHSQHHASDLEIMAASGAMSLAGEENGEPMRVTLPQAGMWAGAEACFGALTAVAARRLTGRGQRVDVSAQMAVMAALAHAPVFWDMQNVNPQRAGIYITGRATTGARFRAFWPCKDGWINFIIYGGAAGRHTNQQLTQWMVEKNIECDSWRKIDWGSLGLVDLDQQAVDALEDPVGRFFLTITKKEFLAGATERQILGYPVSTAADIFQDEQLKERGFWQELEIQGQTVTYPGGFAIVDGQRLENKQAPPSVGEDNQEILEARRNTTANCI